MNTDKQPVPRHEVRRRQRHARNILSARGFFCVGDGAIDGRNFDWCEEWTDGKRAVYLLLNEDNGTWQIVVSVCTQDTDRETLDALLDAGQAFGPRNGPSAA
jgi:hypothetical protein